MQTEDLTILRQAAHDRSLNISITVSACDYNCCGRGWLRREGYEQQFVGYVHALVVLEDGGLTLVSRGVGTISYSVFARFDEIKHVEWA